MKRDNPDDVPWPKTREIIAAVYLGTHGGRRIARVEDGGDISAGLVREWVKTKNKELKGKLFVMRLKVTLETLEGAASQIKVEDD